MLCLLIVLSKRFHVVLTSDRVAQIQQVHVGNIPRIGGLAIALAIPAAAMNFLASSEHPLLYSMMFAASPVFIFGLIEDCTHQVSVLIRLWAALLSGVVACLIFKVSLNSIGIDWIDTLLINPLIAIAFTAFATAGLCSSMNMLDGLNGLASTVAMMLLAAMGVLTYKVGASRDTLDIILLIECAIVGFWLFNWPWGKLFLGDGGAYLLGFLVAWIAILLSHQYSQISPFAFLVICAYPIIETLFSIARRLGHQKRVGQPDQKHLHHWVLFHVKYTCKVPIKFANPAAGLLSALLAIPGAILGLINSQSTPWQIAYFLLLCLAYSLLYATLQRAGKKRASLADFVAINGKMN
jgi:UDP-N-acetylmuramyl pentapeptide phosphotransferase/UDP-N-acetylglucosamine-1-phosphate transferase